MVKRAILLAAVAALGVGAAWMSGCGAGETVPPVADSGASGEGGAMRDSGPDAPAEAGPCGCMAAGVCEPGDELELCGAAGAACAACSFGETCHAGACVALPSVCVAMLQETGIGARCDIDAECAADEWCATSCCDPVGGACFAVWRCAPKRAPGSTATMWGAIINAPPGRVTLSPTRATRHRRPRRRRRRSAAISRMIRCKPGRPTAYPPRW